MILQLKVQISVKFTLITEIKKKEKKRPAGLVILVLCNLVMKWNRSCGFRVFILDMDVGAAACSLSQLCLVAVYRAGHAGKNGTVEHAA